MTRGRPHESTEALAASVATRMLPEPAHGGSGARTERMPRQTWGKRGADASQRRPPRYNQKGIPQVPARSASCVGDESHDDECPSRDERE